MANDTLRHFRSGDFELPLIPDGDSFRVNGMLVAKQLGFRDASHMVRSLADDEKVLIVDDASSQVSPAPRFGGGVDQGVWYLTEPGFYRAVGQRNVNLIKDPQVKAAVFAFQRWVFHDVVPAMVRSGEAQEPVLAGTTWDWHEVSAEIRQRYGLDYRPNRITAGARAAGWLKDGGTRPAWSHRHQFWHVGSSYHLLPHALPDLVADLILTMRDLGDPQAAQYQLEIFPTGKLAIA